MHTACDITDTLPLIGQYSIWIYWVLVVAYIFTTLSCIVVVLSERRNPIKSLAWVIALIFLPVVGLIVYFFFGRSLKNVRMISRHNKRKLLSKQPPARSREALQSLSPHLRQISILATNLSGYNLHNASAVRIFNFGSDKFESLKKDLENARESINLQYYIFTDDNIGNEVADILMRKAREGVTVRVLYDHVGSFSVRRRFFRRMEEAGVQSHPFFRVSFPQFASRVNWRNHRKIVVIDNSIGYIGGMNIADRYVSSAETTHDFWRDTHLRVEGPIVSDMFYSFAVDWNFLKSKKDVTPIPAPVLSAGTITRHIPLQLVCSGPTDRWGNIALVFEKAILAAKKSVYIQTPYFLPTDFLLKALQTAALSNVDVRILIPRKSDSRLLSVASYSFISECLESGIKVYLYNAGMLHAKNMIIDDDFVTTGSANFDFRSFEHNFEGNLLIYDTHVNRRMKDTFFLDLSHATRLTLQSWNSRPRMLRMFEAIVRLITPIL